MPVGFDLRWVLQTPALMKGTLFTRLAGASGRSLMKTFKTSTTFFKTESCRKVNLPCDKEVLHAPRTWLVVQISLSHKKQEASVQILQRFKLLGDGRTL